MTVEWVVVAEDAGSALLLAPLVARLGSARCHVVALSSRSLSVFRAHNVEVGDSVVSDPREFLKFLNPRIVVGGVSSPLPPQEPGELVFYRAAEGLGIPVVVLGDFAGCHSRLLDIVPEVFCAPDAFGVHLATADNAAGVVEMIGYGSIRTKGPTAIAKAFVDGLRDRHGAVHVWTSGRTFQDLGLMIECMHRTKGCFVPLFHPKVADQTYGASTETYGERWHTMLRLLGDRVVWQPHGMASDDIAMCSDSFSAGASTMLLNTAWHGIPTISLWTPDVRASLQAQVGLSEVPLVAIGLAHSVSAPCDLGQLSWLGKGGLDLYDPDKVVGLVGRLMR